MLCTGMQGLRRRAAGAQFRLGVALAAATLVPLPAVAQQTGSVTGSVVSAETGQPMAGVQLVVVGTNVGTVSTSEGRYLLTGVPVGEQTIAARSIGYTAEEVEVTVPSGGSATADFELRASAIELEGMVVTGTAIAAQRREIGNSIALITADDINPTPMTAIDDVLRGKVLGLTVQGTSGQAGAGSNLVLRGLHSVEGRNRPLIYIDGVRMKSGAYELNNEASLASTALNSINPADIERIEVIKGAAATTLYGTEASAGVIQIFTKRGTPGQTRWTATIGQSIAVPGHVGPDIDPTGLHLNDCTANGPVPSDTTVAPDPGCPESGSWLRNAWAQNYRVSASGGGEDVTFFASGAFGRNEGIVNAPDPFEPQNATDINLRANFTFTSWEDFTLRLNNSYTRRDIRWIPDGDDDEGLMFNVTRLHEGDTPDNDDSRVFEMKINQDIDHFTTGANLSWTPNASMRHRLNAGMDWTNSNQRNERPFDFWADPEGNREVDIENSRIITLDYAGSWNRQLPADLSSTLSWGGQFTDREELGLFGRCEGFIAPGEKTTQSCDEITDLTEDRFGFKNGGFFLQEVIGWRNRLFITAGVRADTHSSFGDDLELDQQFAYYPKLQATYTISDHDFWPDWWQTMRFRAAYGESGEPPDPDASQTFFEFAGTDEDEQGFIIQNLGNSEITAERTAEYEVGVDGALLDGRLSFTATGYQRTTTEGIVNIDLAASSGLFEVFPANVGKWEGRGVETALDILAVDLPDLSLNLNGRYQYIQTEMLNFGPDNDNALDLGAYNNQYRVGDPFPAIYLQEMTNPDAVGVLPEYTEEEVFRGQVTPPHTASVGATMTFLDDWTLDLFGVSQWGHVLLDDQAQELADDGLWPACVEINQQVEAFFDNGEPEGGLAGLTAAEIGQCSEQFSDNEDWVFPAGYFRFQSARLAYRLPASVLPSSITGATVQLQAQNLWLFTDYPGIDPDALISPVGETFRASGYTLPLPRVFSLNVRVNF
ncbi:MAG: TonB-dependent receptor domain-containing protein [Longimicrobiales bacterium]